MCISYTVLMCPTYWTDQLGGHSFRNHLSVFTESFCLNLLLIHFYRSYPVESKLGCPVSLPLFVVEHRCDTSTTIPFVFHLFFFFNGNRLSVKWHYYVLLLHDGYPVPCYATVLHRTSVANIRYGYSICRLLYLFRFYHNWFFIPLQWFFQDFKHLLINDRCVINRMF